MYYTRLINAQNGEYFGMQQDTKSCAVDAINPVLVEAVPAKRPINILCLNYLPGKLITRVVSTDLNICLPLRSLL